MGRQKQEIGAARRPESRTGIETWIVAMSEAGGITDLFTPHNYNESN